MTRKKQAFASLVFLHFLLSSSGRLYSQSAFDVYRYTYDDQVGTGRNVAVGGVMGSLGADFAVLSTNPGGLGRYRTTEFGMTGNFVFGKTNGTYLGNTFEDDHFAFNISSAGAVFSQQKTRLSGWNGISFGAGINRLNHYNDNFMLAGRNTNASLLDQHAYIARGVDPEILPEAYPFDAGITYLGELIIPDSNLNYSTVYGNIAPDQEIIVERRGGKYEMVISGAGAFNDKIYIGGTIGIPFIRYDENVLIAEQDPNNSVESYNFFDFYTGLRTRGYGVNFKAGILGRPHELVRIGAAFHTPTYLRLDDEYYNYLFSDFDTVAYEVESPDGFFRYNMVLPWKFLANGAVLLNDYGFIGVEYELQNPAKASLKFKSDDPGIKSQETIRNDQISETFEWQHHIKTGVEIKLDPVRLRAGFQYKTSGIQGDHNGRKTYSGGIGYRGKHFFVDGTYSFSSGMSEYIPYEAGSISSGTAVLDHNRSQVMITVGAKL